MAILYKCKQNLVDNELEFYEVSVWCLVGGLIFSLYCLGKYSVRSASAVFSNKHIQITIFHDCFRSLKLNRNIV